jgi:hypothetical protein
MGSLSSFNISSGLQLRQNKIKLHEHSRLSASPTAPIFLVSHFQSTALPVSLPPFPSPLQALTLTAHLKYQIPPIYFLPLSQTSSLKNVNSIMSLCYLIFSKGYRVEPVFLLWQVHLTAYTSSGVCTLVI